MLKTLRKCTWEEIEVGEVFAWEGCWVIFEKRENDSVLLLAQDNNVGIFSHTTNGEADDNVIFNDVGEVFWDLETMYGYSFYKLPKSVQALWKEE